MYTTATKRLTPMIAGRSSVVAERARGPRVDRVEARHVRRRSHPWIKPSAARHPAQLKKEDVQGDQRKPERGHGNTAEGNDAEHLVGKPVAAYGGDDAERDP